MITAKIEDDIDIDIDIDIGIDSSVPKQHRRE